MRNARSSVDDHQWRAVTDRLVIDEHAVGIDVALLYGIDVGRCRRKSSGFGLFVLSRCCESQENDNRQEYGPFHAQDYSSACQPQQMIENIGHKLTPASCRRTRIFAGLEYLYETAGCLRCTGTFCSSCTILTDCSDAWDVGPRRRWRRSCKFRFPVGAVWRIQVSRPRRISLGARWIQIRPGLPYVCSGAAQRW